ncbi:M48 family metalloprotease [Thiobacillus sp.]|uniref:M48 family metalloprotease n=1 Tax=Thiobacillus sp. TaxID=924 RepID=UPI0025D24C75|nr:M48 family metalloprotease [Thiobacillus sp.]
MTSPPFRRLAVIVLGALSLTHCASNPVSGGKDFVLISEQQEIQMGAQAHEDVLREYAALDNPALQAYVNGIGQKLAKQSHRPDLQWRFTVVDSPDVNAFALPGGYIYITRGLMAYLNSEAELAGVLGHEIGHVTARHGVRQQSASTAAGLGVVLGSILVPGLDSQAATGMMQSVAQAWTAGYGRDHELESDRLGAQYLAKSGYDPQAMIAVIGVLKNQELFAAEQARREGREPRSTYHGTFDSHPSNDARLKQVVGEANQYSVANPRDGRADYLQKIDGLVLGDSPAQGIIRDNQLLHDKLGFAIQFPPGWRVSNQADRVLAKNPKGDALVELQQGPKNDQPLSTLQSGLKLDAGARFDSGQLSGYPAAFAAGTQQGKPVVVASVVFNGTQYLIAGMAANKPAYDRERATLRGAINSFHAITPAERRGAQPYVLKLVTTKAGTTLASLAKTSPLKQQAEAQLRLLNDLYPAGEPKPGQRLKIVQ